MLKSEKSAYLNQSGMYCSGLLGLITHETALPLYLEVLYLFPYAKKDKKLFKNDEKIRHRE